MNTERLAPMNNILNENQNKRYRKKYKYMKIKIRSLIIVANEPAVHLMASNPCCPCTSVNNLRTIKSYLRLTTNVLLPLRTEIFAAYSMACNYALKLKRINGFMEDYDGGSGTSQENAALCDEVAKIQENILIVKDERKFLLRKLLEYENDIDSSQVYYKNEPVAINGAKSKPKKRKSLEDAGKSNAMS